MLGDSTSMQGLTGKGSGDSIPAALTDIGCEREINEDRYAVIDSPSGRAWVVCDGMGGELGGELAAQLAIDAIKRGLESRQFTDLIDAVRCAVDEANRVIVLRRQNPSFSGMGTTAVVAMIQDQELVIANVGDSRVYRVRDGSIDQLTVDHTYVQELVSKGSITQEEALSHPQAHVLTKCLGAEPALEADTQRLWVWEGEEVNDKLVLCSDGLYSLISDEEIADYVTRLSPQECCVQLVELAKTRGGYDNITISVLPLSGTLREEEPKGVSNLVKKKISVVAKKTTPSFSWGKRLVLALMLFLLGGVVGLVVSMLEMYAA